MLRGLVWIFSRILIIESHLGPSLGHELSRWFDSTTTYFGMKQQRITMDFMVGLYISLRILILFGLSWIDLSSRLISYQFKLLIIQKGRIRFTSKRLSDCIRCQYLSSQTMALISHCISRELFKKSWAPKLTSAQLSTPKLMHSRSGLSEFWRTCFGSMFLILGISGISSWL